MKNNIQIKSGHVNNLTSEISHMSNALKF